MSKMLEPWQKLFYRLFIGDFVDSCAEEHLFGVTEEDKEELKEDILKGFCDSFSSMEDEPKPLRQTDFLSALDEDMYLQVLEKEAKAKCYKAVSNEKPAEDKGKCTVYMFPLVTCGPIISKDDAFDNLLEMLKSISRGDSWTLTTEDVNDRRWATVRVFSKPKEKQQ